MPTDRPTTCRRFGGGLYIGLGGTGKLMRIESSPGTTTCRVHASTYWGLLLGFLAFGPYLWWVLLREWGGKAGAWLPLAGLLAFSGLGCLLMLRHLVLQRRIEVRHADGRIALFPSRWARAPELVIRPDEIERFRISETWYSDGEGNRTRNYLLSVVPEAGEPVALCVSTRRECVEAFRDERARSRD